MDEKIQWPEAKYWTKTWNPVIGCVPTCSPACENCYAAAMANRFGIPFSPHDGRRYNPPRNGVVFCGNMTDLFGEFVDQADSEDFVRRSLGFSDKATYMWLTKRPANMLAVLNGGQAIPADDHDALLSFRDFEFGNQYFGFTAETQDWYDERMRIWKGNKPEWANGWLSAEPILGPIDLRLGDVPNDEVPFKWVVVGCESGPKRRKSSPEWIADIVDQCFVAGVKVFVKQVCLSDGKFTNKIDEFPEHLQIRQVPWEN